jgi:hypothetical protein
MTITIPVVVQVSQATRAVGSASKIASRTASEIWSQILSGCPSVTLSDVNNILAIYTLSFPRKNQPGKNQPDLRDRLIIT